jgi:uncharacterized protein
MPSRPRRVATLIIVLLAAPIFGQVKLPDRPEHYVEDLANVINADREQALNGILQELEQKTTVQYIILTVETTGGLAIEQFSIELVEKWKLGAKGKDNGLLFTLAVKDRRYRFEVGYGLEGFITDQYCGRIGREELVPYLRQNNYSEGIYQANLRVIQKIAAEAGVTLTGMPNLPREPAPRNPQRRMPGAPCCSLLFFLLMILFFGGLGGRMGWGWFFLPFMLGGFGGHGGYGRSGSYGGGSFGGSFGGFGGGGFGNFGGGGGGGFGGAGASGGW